MNSGKVRNMYRKPYDKNRKKCQKYRKKMSMKPNEYGYSKMMCTKNSGNIEPKLLLENIKNNDEQKIIEKIWKKESFSEIDKYYIDEEKKI